MNYNQAIPDSATLFLLSRADGDAVDLVLDPLDKQRVGERQGGLAGGSMIMSSHSSSGSDRSERVAATERLLKLLDHLPASDPSESLLSRTLDRIDAERATESGRRLRVDPASIGQPGSISAGTSPHTLDAPDDA